MVHGLEQEYGDQLTFTYVDIDDPSTADVKEKLGYRYQPHFFLLNGEGEIVGEWIGMVREEELRRAFSAVLENE